MVMLVVLTAAASALLDNVTTVLLVAPVTMLVCERLDESEAIRDKSLLVKSSVVLTVVLAGFVMHAALHIDPAIVALLGAGALVEVGVIEKLGEALTEAVGNRYLAAH